MYDLFHAGPGTPVGGLAIPEFRRVREGLQRSIEKVRIYRSVNPMGLRADHPLIRLLMSVNVSLALEPEHYVDRVSDRTYDLARVLGFTSPVSVGKVFTPSMFYGTGVSDLILVTDEAFDLTTIESTWQDLRPIRVISHPQTDLRLHVPDGKFSSVEDGTAVVVVNIPMLALQYKMWRRWERGTFAAESPRTVAQFLMAHPLPNMLYSHIDIAIFNRAFALAFGVPMAPTTSRHPFFLIDWQNEVDAALTTYLTQMQKRRAEMDAVIASMPTVGYPSRFDTLRLPEMPFTYQTMAAIIAARCMPVMFHIQLADKFGNPKDHAVRAYLRRFFHKAENTNVVKNNLAEPIRSEVQAIIRDGILPFVSS